MRRVAPGAVGQSLPTVDVIAFRPLDCLDSVRTIRSLIGWIAVHPSLTYTPATGGGSYFRTTTFRIFTRPRGMEMPITTTEL
jgi:hypothetical protein